VTGAAGDDVMGRGLPALVEGLHIVAGGAELGGGSQLRGDNQNDEKRAERPERDQNSFLLFSFIHEIRSYYA
jgi:hypothetical protein